jgi:hypothetical protein
MKYEISADVAKQWEVGKQYTYKRDFNSPTIYGTYWKDHPNFDIQLVSGSCYYGKVVHYLTDDMEGRKYKNHQILEEYILNKQEDSFCEYLRKCCPSDVDFTDKEYNLLREAVYNKCDKIILTILNQLTIDDFITIDELCQKFGYVNMRVKIKQYSPIIKTLLDLEEKYSIL